MRQTVRAIIINDDALLVMHRNKFGNEYETLIGGGIEPGETKEQALHRELQEESGVQVSNPRFVFIEDAGEPYGMQYAFVCDYVSGVPALAVDSEEFAVNAGGQNLFQPRWLPLSHLADSTFRSETMKRAIQQALKDGFPVETLDITSPGSYTKR